MAVNSCWVCNDGGAGEGLPSPGTQRLHCPQVASASSAHQTIILQKGSAEPALDVCLIFTGLFFGEIWLEKG